MKGVADVLFCAERREKEQHSDPSRKSHYGWIACVKVPVSR